MVRADRHKAGLLYRWGGLEPMAGHMPDREFGRMSPGYIPSVKAVPEARRNVDLADELRFRRDRGARSFTPGGGASSRHRGADAVSMEEGIGSTTEQSFLSVAVSEESEPSASAIAGSPATMPSAGPIIVERSTPGIEVELFGGRRVRFERGTDPETVRAMLAQVPVSKGTDR
jgi:hypothetical protein